MNKAVLLLLLAFLPSCIQSQKPEPGAFDNPYQSKSAKHGLEAGQVIIQGILGAAKFEEVKRTGGENPDDGISSDNLTQMPLIGGNWQVVMGGDRLDYGIEGGGTFGFRSDGGAVFHTPAGTYINVKINLFLLDFYGGPFVSMQLGEKLRVYGALGPLMQFAQYEQKSQDSSTPFTDKGSGFGLGWYTRLGVEFAISRSMMVGLGGRWIDSTVDLSSNLGDLDVQGTQVFLTFSTGF